MKLISPDQSELRVFPNHEGQPRYIHQYFGVCDEVRAGPQGFLVEMPPDNVGKAHFHGTDQFQIFFAGRGAQYQRHPMPPVTVHYSDAYTTYGPFTSGEESLSFFTLRAQASAITAYMPGARDRLLGTPWRNIDSDADPEAERVTGAGESSVRAVIEPQDDQMAAYLLQAGPGASVRGPSPSGSNGQYYCVVRGEAILDGAAYPQKSLGWLAPTEEPPMLRAESTPFAVLVVQFPQCRDRRQE